eukprot:74624-Rhodomonas_salina.1
MHVGRARRPFAEERLLPLVGAALSAYGAAMRCPVLISDTVLSAYAICSTDPAYGESIGYLDLVPCGSLEMWCDGDDVDVSDHNESGGGCAEQSEWRR